MIVRHSNEWNKVKTKNELLNELNESRKVFSDYTLNYFEGLINLTESIADPENEDLRQAFLGTKLYNDLIVYNLYNKALRVFENTDDNLKLSGNSDGIEGLRVYTNIGEKSLLLYDFSYKKENKVGIIKSIIDIDERKKEMDNLLETLEFLYDKENPYNFCDPISGVPRYGGPASTWALDHERKIKELEKRFNEIDRNGFTDEEIKEADITQKYHKLILDEYKIDEKDFKEEFVSTGRGLPQKVLMKKYPGFRVVNNVNKL